MADRADAGAPAKTAPFGELARLVRTSHARPRLVDLASRLEVISHRIRMLGLVRAAEDLANVGAELRRIGQAQVQLDDTKSS
ncbi:MAG TPA: hypothetical protein VHK47_17365 [Polyangia bacterium]|nr:hypothetical protein [Polyangia bacterium]